MKKAQKYSWLTHASADELLQSVIAIVVIVLLLARGALPPYLDVSLWTLLIGWTLGGLVALILGYKLTLPIQVTWLIGYLVLISPIILIFEFHELLETRRLRSSLRQVGRCIPLQAAVAAAKSDVGIILVEHPCKNQQCIWYLRNPDQNARVNCPLLTWDDVVEGARPVSDEDAEPWAREHLHADLSRVMLVETGMRLLNRARNQIPRGNLRAISTMLTEGLRSADHVSGGAKSNQ